MSSEDHKVSKISSDAIFAVKPISPLKFILAFTVCFVLIFLDLRTGFSNSYRGYTQDFLNPVFKLIELPFITLEKIKARYKDKTTLIKELEDKDQKIFQLEITNNQIKEVQDRNKELGLLWDSALNESIDYLLAKKVQISGTSFRPLLVLENLNSVEPALGAAVISKHGITGRISSKGSFNTEVMLVQDPRSFIPVKTSNTNNHAIVQGSGLERDGKLINIKKTANIEKGEELITSGIGGVFPFGYRVGIISEIHDSADDEYLEVKVDFSSDPLVIDFFLVNKEKIKEN